jgi:tetratricopeptide (TPR) repeat protein
MTSHRSVVRSLTFALAAALSATTGFSADTINRKGGKPPLRGTVESIGKTAVVIKTGLRKDKPVSVPVNEIDGIDWDSSPPTLSSVRTAEANGDYATAIKGYEDFLKGDKLKNDKVKTDLQFFIARAKAKQALGDPTKIAAAIGGLEDFRKKNPDSYHHYGLLALQGDLQIAAKNYAAASATFSQLGNAPWDDVKLRARCAEARLLIAQNKPDQALPIYESVLKQATADPLMKPLKNQASLGKAACLQQTSKNDEALGVLKTVITGATAAEAELLAEAYTLQGDSYRALGRSKDALLAYLHVDILFAREAKYHPKSLYYLSQLWAEVGKPVRAGTAKARLKAEYPNSEWAKR